MPEWKDLVDGVKTIGFPALIALYFMVKDWRQSAQVLRALVRIGEILDIEKADGEAARIERGKEKA